MALPGERLLGFSEALEQAIPLRVDALPAWAFRLDPVAARPAHVARRQSLAHDALETKLVAMLEQQRAIREGLHLAQERHSRLAAEPMRSRFTLGWPAGLAGPRYPGAINRRPGTSVGSRRGGWYASSPSAGRSARSRADRSGIVRPSRDAFALGASRGFDHGRQAIRDSAPCVRLGG